MLCSWRGEWIGTHRHIQRVGTDEEEHLRITQAIIQRIEDFEHAYSRFISDSLLSQLNKKRELAHAPWELIEMLTLGVQYHNISEGYFSLLLGSVMEKIGYDASYSFEPTWKLTPKDLSAYSSQEHTPSTALTIRSDHISLSGEQNVDLGGIGKWYLIDKLRYYFVQQGMETYSINGGWDIFHCDPEGLFGAVGIQHPGSQEEILAEVELREGALASSGSYQRKRGQNLHHLINPLTELPAETVLAAVHTYHPQQTTIADIASTALFVAPIEKIEYLAQRLDVEYLLIFQDLSALFSPGFPIKRSS